MLIIHSKYLLVVFIRAHIYISMQCNFE